MGPDKDSLTPAKNQDARSTPRTRGGLRRARRPRSRVCLLKGCGQVFRPQQPMGRYCSEACQTEARRWRQRKARRRYRQSPNGKQKRQAQSRRYRERRKDRQARESAIVTVARVIPTNFFSCSCDRPGCYEEFDRTQRSPLQRFCSHACRQALERVLERERRWRQRRLGSPWTRRAGKMAPPQRR
jgi:hypothetical protein